MARGLLPARVVGGGSGPSRRSAGSGVVRHPAALSPPRRGTLASCFIDSSGSGRDTSTSPHHRFVAYRYSAHTCPPGPLSSNRLLYHTGHAFDQVSPYIYDQIFTFVISKLSRGKGKGSNRRCRRLPSSRRHLGIGPLEGRPIGKVWVINTCIM